MTTIEFFPEWKSKGKWFRWYGGTVEAAKEFLKYYFDRPPKWKVLTGDEVCETRIIKRTVIEEIL